MMDAKLADLISALPDKAVLAGIRAYILHEGLEGNLEDAAKAFEQVLQCEGQEGIKAELAEFLVARYAYRGNLETARKLYARFASLGTSGQPCKRKRLPCFGKLRVVFHWARVPA